MKLRLVGSGLAGPGDTACPVFPGALNMGIDESIASGLAAARFAGLAPGADSERSLAAPRPAAGQGDVGGLSVPTLRFYRWAPACVTIGYFQSMRDEVDLEACARHGVDAVRRVTGGGAVFHDAELTYSLVVPEGGPLSPADILASYRIVCEGLVLGLGKLGIKASFAPINDIQAGGKKLSGNAQTRRKGCLLQHGTVLIDVDVERMFALLKVPAEKLKGKLIEDVKARVTGIAALAGGAPAMEALTKAFVEGFAEAWAPLGVELEPGFLTEAELGRARFLTETRYATPEWNLRR